MFAGDERHTGGHLVLKLLLVLTLCFFTGGESEVRIIYFLPGLQGADAIASGAWFCSCDLPRSGKCSHVSEVTLGLLLGM